MLRDGAELGAIAEGLLEVVADQFVVFSGSLLGPGCEALVERRTIGLRKRRIGRVPEKEVPEPERILARELRPRWVEELLPGQIGEAGREMELLGTKRKERASVEDLAFDGGALKQMALFRCELVEPSAQEGSQTRWDGQLAFALARECRHLDQEERVSGGRVGDLLTQSLRERVRDQLGDRLCLEWLQAKRDGPACSALGELGSGHAEKENGTVPREEHQVVEQVEESLFGPLQIVEDAKEGRLPGSAPRAVGGSPRQSPRPKTAP